MGDQQITEQWREVERMVKESTGADMVEAHMTERGHVRFEVTFANRPDEQDMSELVESFE